MGKLKTLTCKLINCFQSYAYILEDAMEAQKWQQHLSLLREQYINLYNTNTELQREYAIVTASKQDSGFIGRLLTIIASLYNQRRYRFVIF